MNTKATMPPAINSSTSTRLFTRPQGGFLMAGRIYDYSDSLGNVLPLDDSFANNPTARNTGSGADATYINATEASWSFE